MKKILLSMVACASLVGFSACDSFLDEEPKSQLTTNNYYLNEAQAQENVNRLYRLGAPTKYGTTGAYMGAFATLPGMLTGYFKNDYEGQEQQCLFARQLTRQNNIDKISGTIDGLWDDCYNAINVANGAITYIPEINMSDSKKTQLLGEAKFFRAYNYFTLVKFLGDVPMPTAPYGMSDNDMFLSRTPAAQVYSLIESDLKEAVNALPAKMFYENGNRVTKYAAAMLLTSVYMQQAKYTDALSAVQTVLSSPHALTQHATEITAANYEETKLQSAWNQIRMEDGLAESIYAYEFDGTISSSGSWSSNAFDTKASSLFTAYAITEKTYGVNNRYLNIYEESDMRIKPNQFFHWTYTHPNTGVVWEAQEGPGNWFWFDEVAALSNGRGAQDPDLFRYAEALLDAAEAIAQTSGVTAEAAGYLAQIKARANMEGKTVAAFTAELQALSKDAFIEECWKERLREFPLEFKIWDDCVRTGKYPNISETVKGQVTFINLVGAQTPTFKGDTHSATIKDSDLLWPITVNEIQRNPNLTQNPGY